MNSGFSHLEPSQQAIAQLTNEERIAWIRQERWIEYPHAKRILERLADLVDYPPRYRMPCLVIYGATGMGKTRIVLYDRHKLPPVVDFSILFKADPMLLFAVQIENLLAPSAAAPDHSIMDSMMDSKAVSSCILFKTKALSSRG